MARPFTLGPQHMDFYRMHPEPTLLCRQDSPLHCTTIAALQPRVWSTYSSSTSGTPGSDRCHAECPLSSTLRSLPNVPEGPRRLCQQSLQHALKFALRLRLAVWGSGFVVD